MRFAADVFFRWSHQFAVDADDEEEAKKKARGMAKYWLEKDGPFPSFQIDEVIEKSHVEVRELKDDE